jgi:hypothetical protein
MFVITGKIGKEVYAIRCDYSIENIHKKRKDTDTVFLYGNLVFAGNQTVIDKMCKENTIDHGYLGLAPSECEFRDNYLSGELSAYALIYNYVFDSVISTEDNWKWKKFSKRVLF